MKKKRLYYCENLRQSGWAIRVHGGLAIQRPQVQVSPSDLTLVKLSTKPKSLFSGCPLGTGDQRILCLLCRILQLTFHSLRPFFYSDMEPLLKYSPVRLHLSPLLEFLMKTMCSGPRFGYAPWLACSNSHCRLPIMLKWNLKFIFSNSLSPLGTQNKDLNTASQTLLTRVTLHLQCRLPECGWIFWGSHEVDSSAIHQFSLLNSQLIF